jgi:exopolysaccharide production protein ExoQ
MLHSRAFLSFFATLTLFTALAGDAWRNSISWFGWGVVVAFIVGTAVTLLIVRRREIRPGSLPYPVVVFLALAVVSLAWSFYPSLTALGALSQVLQTAVAASLALVLDWPSMLRALGRALKLVLGLSLVFELVVALFVRAPVLPFWVERPDSDVPLMLFWSRDVLFEGKPIQGIVGNSSTLAFVALLGLIVFAVQLVRARTPAEHPLDVLSVGSKTRRRLTIDTTAWLALAAVMVALTRSATIVLAMVILAMVVAMVVLVRRVPAGRTRSVTYLGLAVVIAALVTGGLLLRTTILGLLGKSSDLTGRLDIWAAVIDLAEQRPAFGWGWASYWAPWVEPFDGLVIRNGVEQLHAHNAWLDVWLQLGIVGVVVLGLLALSALTRSWFIAIDAGPLTDATPSPRADAALSLLPLLLLVALLVQSAAESRLLIEYGWILLVYIAIRSKVLPTRKALR